MNVFDSIPGAGLAPIGAKPNNTTEAASADVHVPPKPRSFS